jgi:hypothetical protein
VPDSYNYTSAITIVDHETGKRIGYTDDIVELLNRLHEENQSLLHIIDWCLTHHREVGHIVFDSRDEFFIWLKEKGVLE